MPCGIINDIKIKGIACAVPDNIVRTYEYYDRFGKENVDKFMKMTGVCSRHIAVDKQCVSDLCFTAAKSLIEHLYWEAESIDVLIFITSTPDYKLPPTACVLQSRLGLSKDCIAFDVNLGCSAYVYGLWLIASMLQNTGINRALLLVGNQNNINIDPDDRSTAMLFGDAGTATVMEKCEGRSVKYSLKTNGEGFRHIIVPAGSARNRDSIKEAYLHADGTFRSDFKYFLNGTEVYNFTITEVPQNISDFMKLFNINDNDIDLYVLHQANLFMLKHIATKLKIPIKKLPVSIDKFGNTSGASIPLTLINEIGNVNKDIIRLLLCGFGVGLSWGTLSLDIDRSVCLPLIYSNDFFTKGGPDD